MAGHDGASLDVLLTYSKSISSVSGDVEIPEDVSRTSIGSVHVLLIEEDTLAPLNKTWTAELDQFLHFSEANMRSGKYMAFAAQDGDFEIWDNAQFVKLLQSKGSEIELHEKEHATLHLKLIPKDVTDRVRRQLGI